MSHELRTPLNAIIGFSEIIVQKSLGPVGNPRYHEYAGDILSAGHHLLALINDVLDISKIEADEVELCEENIDFTAAIRSCVSMIKERAQSGGIALMTDSIDDTIPLLRADPRRMKQILINLLSNAIKFTETGGMITIKSRYTPDSGYIFQVIDTGIGIAADDIPKALARFQQIDGRLSREHEGTGLGLPLSKALVELHGGSLDLQSEVGVGTTVTVRFPAERIAKTGALDAVDGGLRNAETEGATTPEKIQPLRILVAEDNAANQAVLRAIFAKTEHKIDIVGNGAEAVSAVMRTPYDLVLMDIQMPEMDGMEATGKIRDLPGAAADIPIIALTANAMKGDREKCLDAGMSDYLSKPVKPARLMSMLAKWAAKIQSSDRHADDDGTKPDNSAVIEPETTDISPKLDEAVLGKTSDTDTGSSGNRSSQSDGDRDALIKEA